MALEHPALAGLQGSEQQVQQERQEERVVQDQLEGQAGPALRVLLVRQELQELLAQLEQLAFQVRLVLAGFPDKTEWMDRPVVTEALERLALLDQQAQQALQELEQQALVAQQALVRPGLPEIQVLVGYRDKKELELMGFRERPEDQELLDPLVVQELQELQERQEILAQQESARLVRLGLREELEVLAHRGWPVLPRRRESPE